VNTPAHLIFGAAAFARPGRTSENIAALSGALLPDLSLYLLAAWSLYVLRIPPETVFGTLYFSPLWQGIFAVDNSIPLWAAGLALGLALRNRVIIAFAGAGLLHLAFDFPLHHDDARRHFWPLSDWVFQSPVSYWNPRFFGRITAPIEVAVCLGLSIVLWQRFRSWPARAMIATGMAAELMPAVMFYLMFRHTAG
jgi:hypothetical protein